VLTNLQLPDHDGLTVALALRHAHPAVAVLILALFDDEDVAARAARAGARGYLAKTAPARELIAAVRGAGRPTRAAVPAPLAPAAPSPRLAQPPGPAPG
jgi:DNA-binding NarL/FixJ family response regulator